MRVCALAALGLLSFWPGALSGQDSRTPIVRSIDIRSDASGLDRTGLLSYVEIEVGQPLAEDSIVRTIRNLVASGVGSDVRIVRRNIEATEGVPVVEVVVVIIADYRVDSIGFEGHLGMKRSRLLPMVEQKVGSPLYEDRLLRSVFALQDLYVEEGYRRARVQLDVDLDEERKLAHVIFRVESGERATIEDIRFEGDLGSFTVADLREVIRSESGTAENRQELRNDQTRLASWLRARGRLQVEVDEPNMDYDPDTDSVVVTFPVRVGPLMEVVVEGAELEELEKEGLLPYLGEAGFDQALLVRSRERVREHFQSKGYYRVEVETREIKLDEEGEEGGVRILTEIDLGPKYRVQSVELEGNQTFSAKTLEPLIQTRARAFMSAGTGVLVSRTLEEDLRNLRAFYLLEGFSNVVVGPAQIEVDDSEAAVEPFAIRVTIPVEEGQRRLVSSLEFEGFSNLDPTKLEAAPLEVGGPFHQQRLDDLVDFVRASYDELGYERAVVTPEVVRSDDGLLFDLTLRAMEGPKSVIDRVVVRGNLRTQTGVVRRVLGLEPKEPLSRSRLLEAQRRLYQLGVFSRASVTAGPRRETTMEVRGSGEEQDEVIARDVIVRLEEGRRWRLGYGVSFDSDDGVGGLFSANYLNFGGRASNLRLDLRANENDERYRLLYTDRSIGRGVTPLSYSVYRVNELISEFESNRYGVQVEAARFFGDIRGSVFFDYRNVDLENVDQVVPEGRIELPEDITRDLAEVEISSVTATLQIDRRDDPLDPERGWGATLQFEQAFSLFSANEKFQKVFFQGTRYQGVGRFGVVAGSLRFGGIWPREKGDVELENPVPIAERFFSGGRTTHRAFERDELGIRGQTVIDGISVGGNGLLLMNLDYRFPIVGPLGGSVFLDGGNVWRDFEQIDPSELRWGAGVGARYLSPVGPLRLEIGWKLDREIDEDGYEVLFSFGNAF